MMNSLHKVEGKGSADPAPMWMSRGTEYGTPRSAYLLNYLCHFLAFPFRFSAQTFRFLVTKS
jgi:hypothetical protein